MAYDIDEWVLNRIGAAKALAEDGKAEDARSAYMSLLDDLRDDPRQAAGVLHMYAIVVDDVHKKLAINEEALRLADSVGDAFPFAAKATLYANIGFSHEALGDSAAALNWYQQARVAAAGLDDDDYGNMMRNGIDGILERLSGATDT
jgi:tetratricopeptide (TPR) repeat protein